MNTWKKIVIASSLTMIAGIGAYYFMESSRLKKRGKTIVTPAQARDIIRSAKI